MVSVFDLSNLPTPSSRGRTSPQLHPLYTGTLNLTVPSDPLTGSLDLGSMLLEPAPVQK